ncbi:hypothetical protein JMF89_15950 [Clostridiaceae bacterium UIB06]|nr:hypothetical protein [Clostridiaceae bacterium UIB06]
MECFVSNTEISKIMGNVSLKIAKEKYDVKLVNQAIMKNMGLILRDEN